VGVQCGFGGSLWGWGVGGEEEGGEGEGGEGEGVRGGGGGGAWRMWERDGTTDGGLGA
jgi:hypothetical protein